MVALQFALFGRVLSLARIPLLVLAVLSLVTSFSSSVQATSGPPPVLNLKTYVSASGKYALEVEPSELYGRGPGQYRLTVDGKEAWSKKLPYTLYDAVVANDGTIIGYAYEHSYDGFALKGGFQAGAGNLYIVILDAKGGVRLNEIHKREHSQMLHSPAEPVVTGILLHESEDRFTIEQGENWWVYQCSSGKALDRVDLRKVTSVPEEVRSKDFAKPIIGTPLTLIEWYRYDGKTKQRGVLFMLVEQTGKPVWSLERPADHTIPGDDAAEDQLRTMIQKNGAILDATKPNQFELWFVADSQRVAFNVVRDQSKQEGWRVEEIARNPYQPKKEEAAPPAIEQRPLTQLGTFKLQSESPAGAIRDVQMFEFDADGRIGAIRWNSNAGYSFVLLESSGGLIAETPVSTPSKEVALDEVKAVPVAKNRWVIAGSERERDNQSWVWWFDAEKKTLSEGTVLDCAEIKGMAATGTGGFVVLATRRFRYTSTEELSAFDGEGKQLWMLKSRGDSKPSSMLSPDDVTVTQRGEVAVIDTIPKKVQLFDLDGNYRRTIDLKKSWGREPNYPTSIMPDVDGGFIVYDSNGKSPFVRMKADGTVREPLHPQHRDGRAVDTNIGIRLAPDRSLWTSDQQSLLRLNQNGVVDLTLGEASSNETLGKIAHATGDRFGNVYLVDERTGAVHVFDSEGKRLRVCKPAPGDFSGNLRWPEITVADDGSVYLAKDRVADNSGYVHFDPDGTWRGIKTIKIERSSGQEWHAQSGSSNMLVLGYLAAFLADSNGNILKKIDRRADRLWLDRVSDAAFASDGAFVILSENSAEYGAGTACTLFTKEGTPIRTFPLLHHWTPLLGYNGTHLVLRTENAIEIYDANGAPVQSFPRPAGEEWSMFLTRDGRELWNVDFPTRIVQRYAMP